MSVSKYYTCWRKLVQLAIDTESKIAMIHACFLLMAKSINSQVFSINTMSSCLALHEFNLLKQPPTPIINLQTFLANKNTWHIESNIRFKPEELRHLLGSHRYTKPSPKASSSSFSKLHTQSPHCVAWSGASDSLWIWNCIDWNINTDKKHKIHHTINKLNQKP